MGSGKTSTRLASDSTARGLIQGGETGTWARRSALAGAAAWAGVALLARMGWIPVGVIELLFLFGPLVIVPLGFELTRVELAQVGSHRFSRQFEMIVQTLQPLGALFTVGAICTGPGRRAGFLALGWLAICGLAGLDGIAELMGTLADKGSTAVSGNSSYIRAVLGIAKIDLVVGGAWFVASRFGMLPFGILEPIGLLTAVHFHFAGFATAIIGASTLRFAERQVTKNHAKALIRSTQRLRALVIAVSSLPFLVAAGFVISPVLRMMSAILFSLGVAALAAFLWKYAGMVNDETARRFLRIAAGVVLVGMVLSTTYAVAVFIGSEALTIPRMASTHGIINAVGFCMFGLLGWLVETSAARDRLYS